MLGGTKRNVINYVAASLGSHTQSEESASKSIAAPLVPVARTTEGIYAPAKLKVNDPNMTDGRLLINRRCIYERKLPGDAYVTAHAERLQHGYFSSENTSDPEIPHVDFLAVNFVMHPGNTGKHRFKSATIKATIQNAPLGPSTENPYPYPQENPKFLMHAPHLIYGAVSPETLQWTFSLAGSLGVSESPVSASVNPSGMRSASYKVYDMMKIQGSCRTYRSSDGPEFDVEDGEIVWSLSENGLQRSGLPREFSFVMLIAKPHSDSKLSFKLDIEPVIDAWYGSYPLWWINRPSYKPMHKRGVNFRVEFGQRFTPVTSERGFNFATLAHSLDDYVNMPGSTYSSNISPDGVYNDPNGATVSNSPFQPRPLGGTNSGNNSRPVYVPGNSQHSEYFDNRGRPEFHYSQPQPLYYPQFSKNGGETWQNSSSFRRGWPSGQPYYAGLDGSRNNPENTINVRVVLDTAATSHIAAATLATPMRKPSPLLKAPGHKNSSSTSDTQFPQRGSTIRTRSLRRTKSRDFLNRLPIRPRSMVETDPAEHRSYDQRQPDNLEPDDAANEFVTNGLEASPVLDSSTMYEINDTPPPNSIRDPSVINGRGSDTPSKPSYQTVPINGTQQQTPLTNGVQSTTPPSSGIRRMRNGVGTGYIRRRSASYAQNGYSHNNNRYSYSTAPDEDDLTMF